MKKNTILFITAIVLTTAFVFLATDLAGTRSNAQKPEDPKMPDVLVMSKDAKLGQVTFDHKKHTGGTYTIDQSGAIACISCHHTAQPAADIAKHPPLKTAWPADRTTTLTLDLFTKNPSGAGATACRDCHARAGEKPKLLATMPEIKHEGSPALISLNNQNAMHRTCAGCHTEVKKTVPASKAPTQNQCMMCHKKAA
ncbi:MAG: cytochrome c3 family protein [Pyrinomonadaceae bacterium]|nr:cytochrome c3 family protein [Pyrinomonadaceae bacterium]MBP6213911.1 cytochrome c3 family protein [Pyrinomonadaceae bacterium]